MNNIDKAFKALNMAGIDAGFFNKGQKLQLAISVKGVDFALHEDEIAKWAATYDETLATAPIAAAILIRRSCQALDTGNPFDDKIRADLQAAMDLLNLCSTHNQDND